MKRRQSWLKYTIKKGDTLWDIARKYGCDCDDLWHVNRHVLTSPKVIFPGQEIVIPPKYYISFEGIALVAGFFIFVLVAMYFAVLFIKFIFTYEFPEAPVCNYVYTSASGEQVTGSDPKKDCVAQGGIIYCGNNNITLKIEKFEEICE